jgi:hypothetical protein
MGPADGQAYTKPLRLGGVERLEEALHVCRQPVALILHGDTHPALMEHRPEMKPACARRIGRHGVRGVEEQVKHQLLELHPIARDPR